MLDTNIVSAIMRAPSGSPVREAFNRVPDTDVCLSIITAAELKFGLANHYSANLAARLQELFAAIPTMAFEAPADEKYAELRATLTRAGTLIGANDLFIAAHALALDLTLVTGNTREFSRVPGLRLQNWLD